MPRTAAYTSLTRSTLAVAIGFASLGVAYQASAFTAFENEDNKFVISGRIAYSYDWNYQGTSKDTGLNNGGSRINLAYEHYFDNGWTGFARWEEGLDPLFTTGENDAHFNRYRYLGASNPTYGTITYGRQDSLMYDYVDVFTDQPWNFTDYTAQAWMGSDLKGGTRPSRSLKYSVNIDKFTVGAMYGFSYGHVRSGGPSSEQDYGYKRKYFYEIGGQYRPGYDVTLGAAFHHAKFKAGEGEPETNGNTSLSSNGWELGANWTPGNWVFSALGGESRNHADFSGHTWRNYDTFVAYTWPKLLGPAGDLQAYGEYSYAKDRKEKENTINRSILGVASISFSGHFIVALEHMWMDDTEHHTPADGGGKYDLYDHDATTLFVRYNY
ncbi:porin [Carnimonas bestiolae]|uniref:porin n=1 Tax=Carnimonas bestiolae TaxID=3402172 RepID=UPI003EDC620A